MAQEDQTKAERKQARAAGGTKAERKQARAVGQTKAERKQARAGGGTKAERRQGRAGRKGGGPQAAAAAPEAPADDASSEERIEWRLARIEEAVAAQSERSDELLERVNAVLEETPQGAPESSGSPDEESD
jgi:hypothetical protein